MPWINLTVRKRCASEACSIFAHGKTHRPQIASICWQKEGLIRDFTHVVLAAEGAENISVNAPRVWVTIHELNGPDWGISGHTDWLRDYTSALDEVGAYKAPT